MNKKFKISHKVFVGMGIGFMLAGVFFMLAVNTVLGIALIAVGLGNFAIGLVQGKKQE
ncbi:MAG: hypothetical protein K9N05_00075 [Candidatus Marinimicrobia bacterium]|nr:hypothetical protein [Candidatus Neomarinimicrobiota bacterium]